MTTETSNRSDIARRDDARRLPLFRETNSGVQAASGAYRDEIETATAEERARALRIVILGGLL